MLSASAVEMPTMPLPELLGGHPEFADTLIAGVQLDSRRVRPGDLFVAMPGEIHDGRQFIEQAVANGASAVVAEAPVSGFVDAVPVPLVEIPELRFEAGFLAARFYRNPSERMRVIGITGTNGKTTTSRIIGQLVRALGESCGVIGTLGASLDDKVGAAANTTPDSVSLQHQLAQWQQQAVGVVSMEVSSHALVQGRVNGVAFETAVFTNLSHDHLDYHGSMEAYGRAKLQLFTWESLRRVVINADDPFAGRVSGVIDEGVEVLTYSARGQAADVCVENAEFSSDGVHGELLTPWGRTTFSCPLVGEFNLANLAAAVAVLVHSEAELAAVMQAATKLQPVPGRMQLVPADIDLQVIVDYAHTPQALEQLLQALRPHVRGSLTTVFGCGGDRDREKRQIMGRVACMASDRVVVTSDNPRSEHPLQIMRDIEAGCSGDFSLIEDRAEAIAQAVAEAQPGDCVVIAGKGHENYQLVEGARLAFSDVDEARKALEGRAPA